MGESMPDPMPISALQHLLFCERQCALIHIEGQWEENQLTQEGALLHTRSDTGGRDARAGTLTSRAVPLRSDRLGLRGVADVVETRPDGAVVPIEYKRGRPKKGPFDRVQLCAQALCLEEMLDVEVQVGLLFYGKTRRRLEVEMGEELRRLTRDTVDRLHELVAVGVTPTAHREPKCRSCSLISVCLPRAPESRTASSYLERAKSQALQAS